jgi:hypothetical protein
MSRQVRVPRIPFLLEGGAASLPTHPLTTRVRNLDDTVDVEHQGGFTAYGVLVSRAPTAFT